MVNVVTIRSILFFRNSLNQAFRRTKVLLENHQLKTTTRYSFVWDLKDVNMPPKRGRPAKAKTAAKVEEKKSRKPKPTESENESDNENGIEESPSKKLTAKRSRKPNKKAESENESDSENGVEEAISKKKTEKKSRKTKRAQDHSDDENGTDEPAPKKAKSDEPKKMMNQTESNLDEINFECDKLNADGEKHNIKICVWNVSGIRAVLKKNGMKYLEREDADIIALQETKCETKKIPDEVKLEGYTRYFLDSKKSGYCGMALYSKNEPIDISYGLKDEEFDDEGRLITAEYESFYLINVYVPNAGQKLVTLPKRLKWNEAFKKHIQELDKKKPVIICGDMNVAHQEIDLTNPKTNTKNAGFTKEERDGMTDFLNAGFVDSFRLLYPDKTGAYTFWSYFKNSRSKNIGWRLDYFIVSERIKNKVCDVVNRDKVFGSDHCPVVFYANL